MTDYSSNIVHNIAKILTLTKEVKNKLDGYPENKAKRPDIAYELLTMLVLADQLKSSLLKKFVLYLYNYWESDPEKIELSENVPMTPMEWVSDGIYSSLDNIRAYAETIFTMFCEDKVSATKQL